MIHVRTDNPEYFGLLGTDFTVNCGKDFRVGSFHSFGSEGGHISNWFRWIFEQATNDVSGSLTKHIGEDIIEFDIGNGQTILCTVFSPTLKLVSFQR